MRETSRGSDNGVTDGMVHLVVITTLFGLTTGSCHDINSLSKVTSVGRLSRQHDGISSIVDGIGDITALCSGWTGTVDHTFQHLRGRNDGLSSNVGSPNHHFLCQKHLGGRDFHSQVTSCHHDSVGHRENGIVILQSLQIFDFGNDLDLAPPIVVQEFAKVQHVLCCPDEGRGNKFHAVLDTKVDNVVLVFVGKGGKVDFDAWQIHVFALANGGIVFNATQDFSGRNVALEHAQDERSIGHQNLLPLRHGRGDLGIRTGQPILVALVAVVGRQADGFSLDQYNLVLAARKEPGANLRSLGVQQDGRVARLFPSYLAKTCQGPPMRLVISMRKVEPGHIHARIHQDRQSLFRPTGRTQRTYNLRTPIVRRRQLSLDAFQVNISPMEHGSR
mmetsp:Transcript_17158/g.31017  ORF Transcript_17158/g.31017 Transcript_17158/m.31017 type:complete len:389 (+) Transcript_17158:622-1788(+)